LKRSVIIYQSDGTERHFTEGDTPLIIGSGTEAHIRLSGVAPEVAYIGNAEGHLFLQPVEGSDPVLFHNNRYLTGSVWLKSGDEFRSSRTGVRYEMKGDCLIFTVAVVESGVSEKELRPPAGPPPLGEKNYEDRHLPVQLETSTGGSKARRLALSLVGSAFLLILLAVIFVVLASPLVMQISPEPDAVTISGFPPCLKIGARRLCLPGTYSVTVEKEGYLPFDETLTVTRSADNVFPVVLEKLPGILNLSVVPDGGVSVYSGDRLVGTTPPARMEIVPGHHRLRITREKYQTFSTEIDIAGEGKIQQIDVSLQPDWGTISFSSVPSGATVLIDGKEHGQTPLSLELLSGDHQVVMTREFFSRSLLDIKVMAGRSETHLVTLQSLPGHLQIISSPVKGAVSIDKKYQGMTPLTVTLSSVDKHEIVLSAPGYKSVSETLVLKPGEEQKLDLSLEQERGTVYLTTNPADARVIIDGTRYSATGKLRLSTQSHRIEVSSPGYIPESRTILPRIGFSQQISIDLRPEGSSGTGSRSGDKRRINFIKTSAGQKLRYVQPAPFTMGASRREAGRRANEGERIVIMKKSYYLAEKPVTNRQYREFDRTHTAGGVSGHTLDGDLQPVVKISWEDAVRYLNWLSLTDNLQPFYIRKGESFVPASPLTNGYRLPTEAEWSFSARMGGAGKIRRYPWDGGFPPRAVSGNYGDEAARAFLPRIINGYRDNFPVTSPVGSFPANQGGFFDMGGNVGEWCHDYYSANSGSSLRSRPDPLGPSSGTHRVIRGSSWRDATITELRLSYRAYHREARDNVGFRVARYR